MEFSLYSTDSLYFRDPVPGGNKYIILPLLVGGVSKVETLNYAHESRGTQI
jgi:hypothetical protein